MEKNIPTEANKINTQNDIIKENQIQSDSSAQTTNSDQQCQDAEGSNGFFSRNTLKKAGIGLAIGGGVIATAGFGAILLGFGSAGIAAGSVAAGIQSSIGSVAK